MEAKHALAEAEKGSRYAPVERLKTEAETALINEGRFDTHRRPIEDYGRKAMAAVKGTDCASSSSMSERSAWHATGLTCP